MGYQKSNKGHKSQVATKNQEQKKNESGYLGLFWSIVLTIGCVLFLLIITDISIRDMDIYNNGNQTVGTIHQIRRSGRRSRNVYVRYRVGNIKHIQRVNEASFFNRLSSNFVGDNILVKYHPDNPNTIIHGTARSIKINFAISIIISGIGLIYGIAGIYDRYMYGKQ